MLKKITRWLLGSVSFRAEGAAWRFVTRAAKEGYTLWNVQPAGEAVCACALRAAWVPLQALAERCGCTLHREAEHGAAVSLRWLKGRKGLLFGAVLAVLLYGQLVGRVWQIRVNGCETLLPQTVLAAAKECGVYEGARRTSFDPRSAADAMLRRLPEAGWISLNTRTCFVEIEVREAVARPEIEEAEGLSIAYAAREGQILSCEARRGDLLVSPGDVVEKGQMLVTGVHETPEGRLLFENVQAEIMARTWRTFTVRLPVVTEEPVSTGEIQNRRSLRVLSLAVPLTFSPPKQTAGTVEAAEHPLVLLGVRLPVSFVTETWRGHTVTPRRRSKEELQQAARAALDAAARAALGSSGRIENSEVTFSADGKTCTATMVCTCTEDISRKMNISYHDRHH